MIIGVTTPRQDLPFSASSDSLRYIAMLGYPSRVSKRSSPIGDTSPRPRKNPRSPTQGTGNQSQSAATPLATSFSTSDPWTTAYGQPNPPRSAGHSNNSYIHSNIIIPSRGGNFTSNDVNYSRGLQIDSSDQAVLHTVTSHHPPNLYQSGQPRPEGSNVLWNSGSGLHARGPIRQYSQASLSTPSNDHPSQRSSEWHPLHEPGDWNQTHSSSSASSGSLPPGQAPSYPYYPSTVVQYSDVGSSQYNISQIQQLHSYGPYLDFQDNQSQVQPQPLNNMSLPSDGCDKGAYPINSGPHNCDRELGTFGSEPEDTCPPVKSSDSASSNSSVDHTHMSYVLSPSTAEDMSIHRSLSTKRESSDTAQPEPPRWQDVSRLDQTTSGNDSWDDVGNTFCAEDDEVDNQSVSTRFPSNVQVVHGDRGKQSKKPRRRFETAERKETAKTRERKSCVRCRFQKNRCTAPGDDPEEDCTSCAKYSRSSKKTIHDIPCYRGRVTECVLYREGGLSLTERWSGAQMRDVTQRPADGQIHTIEWTLGLCDESIRIRVAEFLPHQSDVTARYWMVKEKGHERLKEKVLKAYCLEDIQKTANEFHEYIIRNAMPAFMKQRIAPVRIVSQPKFMLGVVEKTYIMAIKHYYDVEEKGQERERDLMRDLFILWFAMRHTTGMAWISGEDTLGMAPERKDHTYPLFGKVSVPRMIVAQFDSINYTRLLDIYGKKVLKSLENCILENQPRWWFTIYLVLFIILREASWITEDRYRHARANCGQQQRYSIPEFVEKLHDSCNCMLMYWHYYKHRTWPDPSLPNKRHEGPLSMLTPEQYDLVMETLEDQQIERQLSVWKLRKEQNNVVPQQDATGMEYGNERYAGSQRAYDWDHPFYWISQLFEEGWSPHATYQREVDTKKQPTEIKKAKGT